MDFGTLIPMFEGVVGGAASAGVLKGPISSISDLWYVAVGRKTELLRQRAEIINAKSIETYQKEIVDNVSNISPSNMQEPDLSIAGPALEASTYYVTVKPLRLMFARLVASSMDSRLNGITRTAFVQMVKEMSGIDARVLSVLSGQSQTAVVNVINMYGSGGFKILHSNIVPNTLFSDDTERSKVPAALDNLKRMGLIEINFEIWENNLDYSQEFASTPEWKAANVQITREFKRISDILNKINNHEVKVAYSDEEVKRLEPLVNNHIDVQKGLIRVTNLGKDFCDVCISSPGS